MDNYTYITVSSEYRDGKYVSPAIGIINTYLSKGYAIGPVIPAGPYDFKQILYKPQLNELEQAQLRELKRQEDWSPESLAAGTADPRLLKARNDWTGAGVATTGVATTGGTRKNKRAKRSKKSRSKRN